MPNNPKLKLSEVAGYAEAVIPALYPSTSLQRAHQNGVKQISELRIVIDEVMLNKLIDDALDAKFVSSRKGSLQKIITNHLASNANKFMRLTKEG